MVTSKKFKTVLSQSQAQGTESSQLPPGGLWDKTKEAAAAKEMSLSLWQNKLFTVLQLSHMVIWCPVYKRKQCQASPALHKLLCAEVNSSRHSLQVTGHCEVTSTNTETL